MGGIVSPHQKVIMKTIELRSSPFVFQGQSDRFYYRDAIQLLMEAPADPQKGAGIAEIRSSLRILDALEKADGTLVLEDSDFDYLYRRILDMKFTGAHKVFAEFVDYFEQVKREENENKNA